MDRFDDAITTVATETGVDAERLREALEQQQTLAADAPGVASLEDLVYEWRRLLPEEPLVRREDGAYYLAVEEHVWEDFVSRFDFDDEIDAALRDVHARVFDDYDGEKVPLVFVQS